MAGRAANRYAKAILDLAGSKNVTNEVADDMSLIAETISGNAELQGFIQSPTVSNEVKHSALLEVFASVGDVVKNLFRLLFENKRFEILGEVSSEFGRLFEELNGIEKATVTTAIPMDDDLKGKVLSTILGFSNKKVLIENIVDPSIIGGFIIRMGDNQYNASIANRLTVLKREFSK